MTNNYQFDVLIIGSGAAGLMSAIQLSEKLSIAVIAKDKVLEGSSYYAQGGISAVLDPEDNFESHILDTINTCLLYTSPSPRDLSTSRMPSSA